VPHQRRQVEFWRTRHPLLGEGAQDRRDHLAGFLNLHEVTDPDVLAADLFLVVQRGARDGAAGQKNRFQFRDRAEDARLADLDRDGLEPRARRVGLVFVGDGPARGLFGRAGLALQRDLIELNHGAVGAVGEAAAQLVKLADRRPSSIDALHMPDALNAGQPPGFEAGV
jgi:hypothetical protein